MMEIIKIFSSSFECIPYPELVNLPIEEKRRRNQSSQHPHRDNEIPEKIKNLQFTVLQRETATLHLKNTTFLFCVDI